MNTDQRRWIVGMSFSLAVLLGMESVCRATEDFTIQQYDAINTASGLRIENTKVGTSLAMPWEFDLTKKYMKWNDFEEPVVFGHLLADDTSTSSEKIYYFDGPRLLR